MIPIVRPRVFFCLLALIFAASAFAQDEIPVGPPILEQIVPAPGETFSELITIEVQFDRKVVGVDAGDLLINGNPATEVSETIEGHFEVTVPAIPDVEGDRRVALQSACARGGSLGR